MTRPQDMGPADLAPNTVPPEDGTPRQALFGERNSFYNSLPLAEKELFLEVLRRAADRGLDEESAWNEAVAAVSGLATDEL